jgi:hypothetical protein
MIHCIRVHPLCALRFALVGRLRCAFVVWCLLSRPLEGQGIVTVRGTVTNESARPLEQALVILDPQRLNRQVRTDREGRFSFLGVPPGRHSVRVTWVGFTPETRQVEVTAGDVIVDFTLRRLTCSIPWRSPPGARGSTAR